MDLQVKGTLKEILPLQTGTGKTGNDWKKQSFVIETEGEYPKLIAIDLFNDKCDLLKGIAVGSELTVSINLESREYKGRYFTNVNGWKIESNQEGVQPHPETKEGDGSGLPF